MSLNLCRNQFRVKDVMSYYFLQHVEIKKSHIKIHCHKRFFAKGVKTFSYALFETIFHTNLLHPFNEFTKK